MIEHTRNNRRRSRAVKRALDGIRFARAAQVKRSGLCIFLGRERAILMSRAVWAVRCMRRINNRIARALLVDCGLVDT